MPTAIDFQPDSDSKIDFAPEIKFEADDPNSPPKEETKPAKVPSQPWKWPQLVPPIEDITGSTRPLKEIPGYVANVARAIPADVAAGMSLFKRPEGQPKTLLPSPTAIKSAIQKNLPAAAEASGNIPAALSGSPMPIDAILSAAAKEDKTAATIGKISNGLAATAPMAAIGALPSAAQKLALIGFTAKMMSDAPELATQLGEELGKPEDQRDPDKLTTLISDAIQVVGFSTLGAKHLISRGLSTINDYAKDLTPRGQGINFDISSFNEANKPTIGAPNAIQRESESVLSRLQSRDETQPQGSQVSTEVSRPETGVRGSEGQAQAQPGLADVKPSPQVHEEAAQSPPPPPAQPVGTEAGKAVTGRDWDLFSENLAGELDTFYPARNTGARDYDLIDAAQRFSDFAKSDTSGKPLDKLVSEFAKVDKASPAQIRKIRQGVKNVLASETEASKPPTPEPPASQKPAPPAPTSEGKGGYTLYEKADPTAPKGKRYIVAAPDEYGIKLSAKQSKWKKVGRNLTKEEAFSQQQARNAKAGIEQPTPPPTAGAGEKPLSEGPGAASPGDVPKKAQIEQLASAFKGSSTQRQTLRERVKEIFDLTNQKELTKDLLARTLSSLKNSGDYLINTWKGQADLDPILKSKGLLSAELEMRGWRMRQAAKEMKRAVPDRRVREAIAKYVDAGGDMAKLQEAANTVPKGRRAPYERAMNLSPEEKIFAEHIKSFFESRLQEAIDAGVLKEGIEDYIHRIYPRETDWKKGTINAVQSGILDTRKPGLAMQRVFELDSEAEKAGYHPTNDFIPRILDYEASLSKVIASRAAVKRFTDIDMPDGRKMLETSGVGIPIENAEGIREATLIRPSGRPANLDLTGYQARDYPALKKWKWAAKDPDGNPIFVEGNVLIHPDAVHRIDALLEPSKVRKYAAARAALSVGSVFKQTMLDFSGFHQVQIAIHGLEHRVNPFKLVKEVNFEDPNIQGLLKGGMTLGGGHVSGIYQEGLVGRSLSRQIPGLGEVMRTYHEWLFQDFIPRMKVTMALHALERNRQMPTAANAYRGFGKELASGKMSEDMLFHQTAKEANAAFGELNYIMLERSKTAQDLARLILLAPDFLEARGRFAAQSLTRLGGEQRVALLLGALTMYTAARLMNKTADDQWHFEPENAFSLVHNGKAYSIRTVQGDILHALEEPVRFWLHRLNPTITRPMLELMTQRDEFGRKRGFWQVVGDTISNLVPISMRNSREQKLWVSLLNAFGGSVRRYSEVNHVFEKAKAWNQAHNVKPEPGEFIYDPSKDIYRPLKLAILDGDTQAAALEYRKLLDAKTVNPAQAAAHFAAYAKVPFTGSNAREAAFKASLSADEKKAYEAARQERNRVHQGFISAAKEAARLPPTPK